MIKHYKKNNIINKKLKILILNNNPNHNIIMRRDNISINKHRNLVKMYIIFLIFSKFFTMAMASIFFISVYNYLDNTKSMS